MLNKVIIMGRLARDPELKTTASDVSVCSFTVAVDRRFQRSGEERQADFINVVAWRQTAEFVSRYFTKGRMINVVGSLQTRSYDDANGNKRYVTEVVADEVNFCGDKRNDDQAGGNNNGFDNDGFEKQGFVTTYGTDDNLPF
ncbi:MAG: single-stranded DNA-binding protein [Eubacteriales bacterium]|nr:single-stranded DNA-binding protein [Eubacteriales bacterium]